MLLCYAVYDSMVDAVPPSILLKLCFVSSFPSSFCPEFSRFPTNALYVNCLPNHLNLMHPMCCLECCLRHPSPITHHPSSIGTGDSVLRIVVSGDTAHESRATIRALRRHATWSHCPMAKLILEIYFGLFRPDCVCFAVR